MRTIAIYACMVISFLQLASCSAHHKMYVGREKNESIAMSGQKKADRREAKEVLHSNFRSIDSEEFNFEELKRLRRWSSVSTMLNEEFNFEELKRLRRWTAVSTMLNVALLASLGYLGFWYWSNKALGITDVMKEINGSLALIYSRLTPIEKNVSNAWTYLTENVMMRYSNVWGLENELFGIEEAYLVENNWSPASDNFEACIGKKVDPLA